jgi:hypothetical protein
MALGAVCRHPCVVRLCGQRLRVIACLFVALVAALTLSASTATGAKSDPTPCTWGASSVRAEVVDGKVVTTQPATSGCIP